jgi:hypothetical protein
MPAAALPPWLRTFDPRRPEGRSRLLPLLAATLVFAGLSLGLAHAWTEARLAMSLLALAEPAEAAVAADGTWTSAAPGADPDGGERFEAAIADARQTERTWAGLLGAAAALAAGGGAVAARRRARWRRRPTDHGAPFALDPVPAR